MVPSMGKNVATKPSVTAEIFRKFRDTLRFAKTSIAVRIWLYRFSAPLLKVLGWQRLEVTDLSESHFHSEEIEASSAGVSVDYAPFGSQLPIISHSVQYPLRKWTIRPARIVLNTKFPSVEAKNRLWITPRFEEGPYSYSPSATVEIGSQIRNQSDDFVLRQTNSRVEHLQEAIYCGTRSAKNWGHWLMNFLPGVMIAAEHYPLEISPPLMVPPEYRVGEPRQQLFDLMWGQRPVVVVEPRTNFEVDTLHWFEQPILDSPRPTEKVRQRPKMANVSALLRFRHRILDFAGIDLGAEPQKQKLFLAREHGGSREYDRDRVHKLACEFGYEVVFLNRLPIVDQIKLIFSARKIVAPDGSALASLLFSHPSSKTVVLTRVDDTEDWFAFGARISGSSAQVIRHCGYDGQAWDLDPTLLVAAFTDP